MLRRSICTILCLALILMMPGVLAQESSGIVLYEIPELGVSLSIPEHLDVFTRNTPEDSELFEKYDLTPASLAQDMTNNDTYLIAYEPSTGAKIEVSYVYSPFVSFDNMSTEIMDEALSNTMASFESSGFDVECEFTKVGNHTFLKIQLGFAFTPDYKAIGYMTAQNYAGVRITLFPDAALTEADKILVNDIAASLVFHDVSANDAAAADTITAAQAAEGLDSGRIYHDPETNISFTIHSNWEQDADTTGSVTAQFVSLNDTFAMFAYSGSYIGPITFTKEELIDIYSLNPDEITTRQFAGYDFFVITFSAERAAEVIGVPADYTMYISTCNDNLIIFALAGIAPGSACGMEAEAMLNTISFE